jgi:hypothetical protein
VLTLSDAVGLSIRVRCRGPLSLGRAGMEYDVEDVEILRHGDEPLLAR